MKRIYKLKIKVKYNIETFAIYFEIDIDGYRLSKTISSAGIQFTND